MTEPSLELRSVGLAAKCLCLASFSGAGTVSGVQGEETPDRSKAKY